MCEKMEKNCLKKRSDALPELLAPVGSAQSLSAAITAGADAVYLGATQFSARAFAHNFDRASLRTAVEVAHKAGVRVYLALNTLITDRQMAQALELAAFAYEVGVDALIVADLGLATLIHNQYPDFSLHASTQCSGHSSAGAKKLAELGFDRMVAARELSADAMAALVKGSPIPIEVFVHGALCVSASGQCLFSSIVGGRSGNRGECAQPCRMNYNGNGRTPLSLKDLTLANHIPELIDMGVASLKIEGRMKSPTYVYTVVSIFRRLLDERRSATPKEMDTLASVFSRDGFTDGYYTGNFNGMNGIRREADKEASRTAAHKANRAPNIPAFTAPTDGVGEVTRKVGTPLPPIELARTPKAPVLPPLPPKPTAAEWKPLKTARFYRPDTIPEGHDFDVIFLPLDRFDGKKANGVLLPPVIWDCDEERIAASLEKAKASGAEHIMVTNIGQLSLARASGMVIHGDWRLNIENSYAAEVWRELDELILTPELILPQMRDIPARKSAIVYGRAPLMLLEKPCGAAQLVDRRKALFPVIKEGRRVLVLNSVPTYMADRKADLDRLGLCGQHFLFTIEGAQEVRYILDCYKKGLPTKKEIRRMK